jgi:hypothetical protein
MSAAKQLLPHAFMALTGTTLHDRILVVSVLHYFVDYWMMFNESILFGMSGAIHLIPPCLHGRDRNKFT